MAPDVHGRVLLVDDNAFNRDGMRRYLVREGFAVAEASDAAAAWRIATTQPLDAAVLDVVIPREPGDRAQVSDTVGVKLASDLKARFPALGVVLFSAHDDRGDDVFNMVRAGTRGVAYKLKGCPPAALLHAIEEVRAGRVVIDDEVTNRRTLADDLIRQLTRAERPWVLHAVAHLHELTPREKEIAQRVAAAHTMAGIMAALDLKAKTVENHILNVYSKLGLSDLKEQAQLRQSVILAKACMIHDLQAEDEG